MLYRESELRQRARGLDYSSVQEMKIQKLIAKISTTDEEIKKLEVDSGNLV